jgi:ubiquinone/menaquinone biosynthesis C-methylase UbiE
LARLLKNQNSLRVLDIATGTGDLLLSLFNAGCPIFSAVGLDLSSRMLEIAGKKLTRRNLAPKVVLKQADALSLP